MNEWHHQSSKRNKWQIKTHNYQYQWFIIVSSRTSALSIRCSLVLLSPKSFDVVNASGLFFSSLLFFSRSLTHSVSFACSFSCCVCSFSHKFPSRLSWMFYFHVYWSCLLNEWSALLENIQLKWWERGKTQQWKLCTKTLCVKLTTTETCLHRSTFRLGKNQTEPNRTVWTQVHSNTLNCLHLIIMME